MSRKSLRRFITAGGLAAGLALAGAAPAHARDTGSAVRAWQWIQNVWERGFAALWEGSQKPATREKEGPGLDPDGSPKPSAAGPACATCDEEGPGLDPDG